jgi:hypothetical protein
MYIPYKVFQKTPLYFVFIFMLALTKVSNFYIKFIEQTNNWILVLKKDF